MSQALESMTREHAESARWSRPVQWYRTPLSPETLNKLHSRSDLLGAMQTFGYLGTLIVTGGLAVYSAGRWPWWSTVLLVFLHGTCFAFQINAVHELGHGTVFKTRWLNALFERVFSFLGWINFHMFDTSHVRHHQFTLHPPDDLEVVLPMKMMRKAFLRDGIINPRVAVWIAKTTWRVACGRFEGEWELALFPPDDPERRRKPVRWARILLIGHGLILLGSVAAAWLIHPRFLMIPVVVSLAPCYGAWLHLLCNSTQHIGLQDNVPDFRLCCRTFTINPIVQFLYWHMNYHIEHHMYAAVPCYRLGQLHRAILHDLPPTPHGLRATWKEIFEILDKQEKDPTYQYQPPCPNPRPKDIDQRRAPTLQPASA